jgi:hypothetical protein
MTVYQLQRFFGVEVYKKMTQFGGAEEIGEEAVMA